MIKFFLLTAGVALSMQPLASTPPLSTPPAEAIQKVFSIKETRTVWVTAYSSTPEETDDTPFITASGKHVAENIIANNLLPFGTKIKIPELYGNKVFIVGDRMASYKSKYHIDLWMPSKALAINFGVKTAEIQVLEN